MNNTDLKNNRTRIIIGAISISTINQIVSSGTNFVLSVYLVKILSPSDYGLYGIGFAISLFFCGIGNGLFLTQMVVNTANKIEIERPLYATNTLVSIIIFSVSIALLCSLAFLIINKYSENIQISKSYFFSVVILSVSYLIKDFFVRHAYNIFKESWALYIHLVLAICLAMIIEVAHLLKINITVSLIIFFYSFAYLCASVAGGILARLPLHKISSKQLWNDFSLAWRGGRWAMITSMVYFARTQAHVIVVTALMGPIGIAKLNATRLLVSPPIMAIPALNQVIFPRLARFGQNNFLKLYDKVKKISLLILSGAIFYSIILMLSLDKISIILFDSKYNEINILVFFWCLYVCVFSIRCNADMISQVMFQFKLQMLINIFSSILSLGSTYLLVRYFNNECSVIGLLLGEISVLLLLYIKLFKPYANNSN